MLTSITPLGERSRGFSWRVTATAFAAGAVGTGVLAGWLTALLGSVLPLPDPARGWLAALALALALGFDASSSRMRLPSTRRQVNEDWMNTYRGWVYGLAFGAQLGVGVATIVTSAAVYSIVVIAFLSGAPVVGALAGGTFAAGRAASLLAARSVIDTTSLMAMGRGLGRWEARTRMLVPVTEAGLLAGVVGALA